MLAATGLLAASGMGGAEDLTALSLEELMAIEVVSTPQFAGRVTDLPASVSILTASDIRAYGWRTLADALRSLRGFNVTYDRTYSFAGVRGLSPPGDYKPRLSVLIDGVSATENIYDSVLLGGEFPLDIDLIERIEVVRGPSSSVVGASAMGGVINIITRGGASQRGVEVAASAGSGDAAAARASVGGSSAGGTRYLIAASGYGAQGEKLNFPEMAPLGRGTTTKNDDEKREQLFFKIEHDAWHALLIHGERDKTVATGSYGTLFNDPSHEETDAQTLAEIGHKAWLDTTTTLSTTLFTGAYAYDGIFPYADADLVYRNRDRVRGQWWGAGARVQSRRWQGHQVMAGAEFIDNYRQDQRNDDIGYGCYGYGGEPCLDSRHSSTRASLYGQDEILLTASTRLTLGLRLDRTTESESRWSPRVGLVQHTQQRGTFKLLYATAYREPSAFERYYTLAEVPTANPGLKDERLQSVEALWEYGLDTRTQLTALAYHYRAENVITPGIGGLYRNLSTITGRGAEFEIYRTWPNRSAMRASYSLQFPELAGERPANAPQHLLKLNLTAPIAASDWSAGFEFQATSKRRTETGPALGGYGIANLNVIYAPRGQRWDIALGIYNLFDQRYADPIAPDEYMDARVVRHGIEQDGRSWRSKFTVRF